MKNPFTSGNDIFSNISKPKPRQSQPQSKIENQNSSIKSNDLNFRGEFRSMNNIKAQKSDNQFRSNVGNQQHRGYIDKKAQLISYQPQKPVFKAENNAYLNPSEPYKKSYEEFDPRQYKRSKNTGGGEQKITFGNPLTSQDANPKAKLDLKPFVYNRNVYQNDLSSDASSFQNQSYSQSNYSQKPNSQLDGQNYNKKSYTNSRNIAETNQFQGNNQRGDFQKKYSGPSNLYSSQQRNLQETNKFGYQSKPEMHKEYQKQAFRTRQMNSLSMSPIAEASKHKIDNLGDMSDFMNLDSLGDDIDKLLANSKNHQELCKLIGVEGMKRNHQQKRQSGSYGKQQQTEYIDELKSSSGYSQYANHQIKLQKQGYQLQPQQKIQGTKHYPQYNSKNSQTQQNFYEKPRNDQQQGYNNYASHQNGFYKDQNNRNSMSQFKDQRFSQQASSKKESSYQISDNNSPVEVFNYQDAHQFSRDEQKNVKSKHNLGSDLQKTITRQMKKLYQNGKIRTFLSASDRIQTIKYDLQPI